MGNAQTSTGSEGMGDRIVSVRAEKLQATKSSRGHSDDDDGAKGEIHSDSDDDGGFQLPGDFGSTLFQISRASLEDECERSLEAFCNEAKAACEAAAETGAVGVVCSCDLRQDRGVQAVFLEALQDVFGKAGVHVMRGQGERVRPVGEVDEDLPFLFKWGDVDHAGILREGEPTGYTTAIKPAGRMAYQEPETHAILNPYDGVVRPNNEWFRNT